MRLNLPGLIFFSLLFTGCMHITTSLQPENTSVPVVSKASDCVPIILGFAYGHASVEGALAKEAEYLHEWQKSAPKITKVRRVEQLDLSILMFGTRCVDVIGQ